MATTLLGEPRATGTFNIRSAGGVPIVDEQYEYFVLSDNITDSNQTIYSTAGLPTVGVSTSPSGLGICTSKSGSRDSGNQFLWRIVCSFSTEVEERQSSYDPGTDPEVWVPIYETKFERLQEVVTVDKDGDAIANSAGQPFPGGMTVTRLIPIWEFFQLEPESVTDEQIMDRNETVNSGTFKGRAAKTLLLTVNSSVVGYYYGQRRRLTQYALRYNKDNWQHKRLDVGEAYKDGSALKPYLVEGRLVMGPLNGSGAKTTAGDPPFILKFDRYTAVDFSSFLRI
jgi:hypothetical protein